MNSPAHVTQSQIARAAGVSQSAVSTILSGSGALNVSEETRRHVLQVAEQLGYVARGSLARNRNEGQGRPSVLLVRTPPPTAVTNEPWMDAAYTTLMGRILSASGHHLQEQGIGLSVFHLHDARGVTQWLADSDFKGVLWHAGDSDGALLHWIATRFPLVLLNRKWEASVAYDSVSVDQERNVLIAADHLWSLGHRRIAVFGHAPGNSFYRRRMEAYRRFVGEKALRNYVEFQEISDAGEIPALEKVAAMLDLWKRLGDEAPTALVTSDVFALPLLREARRAGIDVPRDLSVIGIDNTAPCAYADPTLTSMEEPFEEMCRVAVELLLRRKADPKAPSQSVQIAPRLILRQSVARLAGGEPASARSPLAANKGETPTS